MLTFKSSKLLTAIIATSLLSACGASSKGKIKLQMSNTSAMNFSQQVSSKFNLLTEAFEPFALNNLSPTKFEMKVLAAYVVEDVDSVTQNNVGEVGMVWLNKDCGSINDCTPAAVDFSDLTDPEAFNSELSSQALEIVAGTYRYARLEFCQGSAGSDNVRYTYNDSNDAPVVKTAEYGGCGVTSVELAEPIALREGESLTISLSYDLSDGEVYWADGSTTCTRDNACLGGIDLVPAIVE